jgi:hypothetical protein
MAPRDTDTFRSSPEGESSFVTAHEGEGEDEPPTGGAVSVRLFGDIPPEPPDNANNSDVTVVVVEVILFGDVVSKFLWILVLVQLHWNEHERRGQFRSPKA